MAREKNVPGGTGMLLLSLLSQREMYGYEMIAALRERSNHVFDLKAGTLYPLLHTLEAQGYVSSRDGAAGAGRGGTTPSPRRAGEPWRSRRSSGGPTPTGSGGCWKGA